MDFPQQIEETLVERPESVYDVIMESPLYSATMERKVQSALSNKVASSGSANKVEADKMSSSLNSTLEDTTPSDSGIHSESSEFMIESITSQTGFEFEETQKTFVQEKEIEAVLQASVKEASKCISKQTASSMDTNSNVTTVQPAAPAPPGVEEAMSASACSTFDTTENIVYRRKVRKTPCAAKATKKRVSFHEDILKNTRTDNIHIEHGFVTYKNGRKIHAPHVGVAGRYSWCSEGDRGGAANVAATTELCTQSHDDEDAQGRPRRCVVYRNACSDVLDYGNSDFYDTNESNYLQYDNSGVFEYLPKDGAHAGDAAGAQAKNAEGQVFYRCSCSSSNSSLDSDENDKNSNRQEYGQAKSSSCDCIGMSNANNNLIGENCYFSEPNIDNLNENNPKKSVWNKEKKPKSSCLKKTKRHTNIIYEQDLTTKMKKFNVHDMNTLIDNSSKMIFGSLKSIFTMPLPERGVPEGSEDLQAVIECVPELEQTPEHKPKPAALFTPESPPLKQKPFLSKSLDGSKQQQSVKKFVHNVDEQLRRKNDEELYTPTRQNSEIAVPKTATLQRQDEIDGDVPSEVAAAATSTPHVEQKQFRNKFIINCESTVFEHTGVCYELQNKFNNQLENVQDAQVNVAAAGASAGVLIEKDTPTALQPELEQIRSSSSFISTPLAKTFSNFFRSFKEPSTSPPTATVVNKKLTKEMEMKTQQQATDSYFALKMNKKLSETPSDNQTSKQVLKNLTTATSSSTISELTTSTNSSLPPQKSSTSILSSTSSNSLAIGGHDLRTNLDKQSRHLPSPLKKRASGGNLIAQPQRYGIVGGTGASMPDNSFLSPDLFNSGYSSARGGSGRDSKSTILSEEFDDILTITTDTDKNESDIVIVDYPELSDRQDAADYANLLKPPQAPTAKTSLINRFLRNVTQKKILESSIRKNNFFAGKLKNEQKLFTGHLYVPGMKPKNYDLIDDLNAEIAMEIEMSGANSPRRELASIESDMPGDSSHFELGIGEISIDIFNGNYLHILRDATELLMKVFKLYTGYSREGFMTPVLVFLTDKTLYVTDLVRNRLCTKFMLAYTDLDVILMGPYGNTVLLSNSARDMQQVLLAGGPYPADGLVANLELCARRSGSTLPAVGQLTLQHLAPLRAFVHENSCVDKNDTWMYYAVVNVPAGSLGSEQEPLGPHVKGFLMHRRVKDYAGNARQSWNPGYFLLKAGVLYMFNDSSQKLPSWAMALAECQGARRAVKAGRPHCFEILLKGQLLQLAAPDEYVASEWLQALLQSASGLFEMQEKHKTLGCTLIVTQNHLITLREDFAGPLRQINKNSLKLEDTNTNTNANLKIMDEDNLALPDTGSVLSSAMSTPSKGTQRSCSSVNSTPTKLSQLSRSTNASNTITCTTTTASTTSSNTTCSKQTYAEAKESYSNMSSVYGKNSGLEILTCADIKEMTGIKIPSHNDAWWCILEFSCQEVRECSDDLALFFASSSEMQRFLRLLEQLWQAKNNDLFPITILDEDDLIAEQCTVLYMDINRAWEPLLSSALGYPL